MKTSIKLVLCLLMLVPFLSNAQSKGGQPKGGKDNQAKAATPASANCFDEWYTLFQARGGKPVPDGTHEVIITLRNNNGTSQCFMGKVDVAAGKLVLPLYIQKDDGSFETFGKASGKKLDPMFAGSMTEDELLAVTDAMSISFRTSDLDFGRLFFYKFLQDIPKKNKVAPSPKSLIKN